MHAEKQLNKLVRIQPIRNLSEHHFTFDTTSLADKQSPPNQYITITKGLPGQKQANR